MRCCRFSTFVGCRLANDSLARASHRHQAAWPRDCAGPGGRRRRARLLEGDGGGLSEHQILNKVALSVQVNMKVDLREIYGAPTRAAAEAAIDVFADKYNAKHDKAVACLTIGLSAIEGP